MDGKMIYDQTDLIEAGDHLGILYDDIEEITSYVISFLKASLLRNERCVYIKGDANDKKIISMMRQLSRGISTGDFIVLDPKEVYSKQGEFKPDWLIHNLKDLTELALEDGLTGLSVTGEIGSVLEYDIAEELMRDYEVKFSKLASKSIPITALCRYNLEIFPDKILVDVIQLHPYLVYKNDTHENPFYIPSAGYENDEIPSYQVKTWLKNIDKFTGAKTRFYDQLAKKEQEMDQLQNELTEGIINSMFELLSIHDTYTTNHSQSVADLSKRFAKYMGMNDTMVTKIYYAGLVHDIGKVLIPREILIKAGSLNYDDYIEVQKHPVYAHQALVKAEMSDDISKAVRAHHERWDGCGYPDGLRKDDIPIMARMLAIVDSYDAMLNDRAYREKYGHRVAIEEIFANAGTKYDPYLASEFIKMLKKE